MIIIIIRRKTDKESKKKNDGLVSTTLWTDVREPILCQMHILLLFAFRLFGFCVLVFLLMALIRCSLFSLSLSDRIHLNNASQRWEHKNNMKWKIRQSVATADQTIMTRVKIKIRKNILMHSAYLYLGIFTFTRYLSRWQFNVSFSIRLTFEKMNAHYTLCLQLKWLIVINCISNLNSYVQTSLQKSAKMRWLCIEIRKQKKVARKQK